MMRATPKCAIPVVLVLVLAAPALRGADERMTQTPYYPLQVGATWHYRAGGGTFSVRVAKHEKVDGRLCARLEVMRDGKVRSVEHVFTTDDGIYRKDIQGPEPGKDALGPVQTLEPPLMLLKLPPRANDSWSIDSQARSTSFKGKLKVSVEEVKVPAGAYKAFRVNSQDVEEAGNKLSFTTYYAEGVGMVKQVLEVERSRIVVELVKFEPGK